MLNFFHEMVHHVEVMWTYVELMCPPNLTTLMHMYIIIKPFAMENHLDSRRLDTG